MDGVDFRAMEKELQGKTKPVVSKKVLAKTVRTHADCIQKLAADLAFMRMTVTNVQEGMREFDEMKVKVARLERALESAQETITKQERIITSLGEVATYGDRMDVMHSTIVEIKSTTGQHTDQIAALEDGRKAQRADFANFVTKTDEFHAGLQDGSTTINAMSVRVEGEKGDKLDEVLRLRKKAARRLEETIFDLKEAIEAKGDKEALDEALEKVEDGQDKMMAMKTSLGAIGIDVDAAAAGGKPSGALVEMAANYEDQKKQLKTQASTVKRLERSLLDKADLKGVDAKIELKYQEIVDHLQSAISSAADDEAEFKNVADDLRTTVQHLIATKADATQVMELREALGGAPLSDQFDDIFKKLDGKVDKSELESLLDAMHDAEDEAAGVAGASGAKKGPRGVGFGPGQKRDLMREVRQMVDKSIKQHMENPSSEAGWATTSSARPMTGAMRGQRSLTSVCISCNARILTQEEREAEWDQDAEGAGAHTHTFAATARPGSGGRRRPGTSGTGARRSGDGLPGGRLGDGGAYAADDSRGGPMGASGSTGLGGHGTTVDMRAGTAGAGVGAVGGGSGTVFAHAARPGTSGSLVPAGHARDGSAAPSGMPVRRTGRPSHPGPQLGPGGPALGGGFAVRLPPASPAMGKGPLPKLEARPASPTRVIIGADGVVYNAADVAAMQAQMRAQGGYPPELDGSAGPETPTPGEAVRGPHIRPSKGGFNATVVAGTDVADPALVSSVSGKALEPGF